MQQFGLIGQAISYSFSEKYFAKKFEKSAIKNCNYSNFDINSIAELKNIIQKYKPKGLNVTIPYKQEIIPFLDEINKKALEIGAVNTVKISENGKLKGYNTDEYGFRNSLKPLLKSHHTKALILGTGGASKAIAYSLSKLDIDFIFVSRNKSKNIVTYSELDDLIQNHYLIINCTPLGTHPNVSSCPEIPYELLTEKHLLYDLVYNPDVSLFLQKGKNQGASIKNGYEMLVLQAEKSWEIWNK